LIHGAAVAAVATQPNISEIAQGFIPQVPAHTQYIEVLPWLGFMLAGAAGLMWFSYWIRSRGYGAAHDGRSQALPVKQLPKEQLQELKAWIQQMSYANTLAVVGALIIAFAFLILGKNLLQPQGLIPEESKVAATLGELMGALWGHTGFVFMVTAVFITFLGSMLAGIDGFSRMFSDGISLLAPKVLHQIPWLKKHLQALIVWVLLSLFPCLLYLWQGEPIFLLKLAGAIEAAHIPAVAALILVLNYRALPVSLRANKGTTVMVALAALFFTGFALVYLLQIGSS